MVLDGVRLGCLSLAMASTLTGRFMSSLTAAETSRGTERIQMVYDIKKQHISITQVHFLLLKNE
jgi:hypothetical protein